MLAIVISPKNRVYFPENTPTKKIEIDVWCSKMREKSTAELCPHHTYLKVRVRLDAFSAEKLTISIKTDTERKKIVLKDVRVAKLDFWFFASKLLTKKIEFAH